MRFLRSVALAATALTVVTATSMTAHTEARASSARASSCGGGTNRWYAYASSGSGSNQGTGGTAETWTHWSVNGHSDGFTDEAVWTYNTNNNSRAFEVGFSSGSGVAGFSNAMYPYVTLNNGANEWDFESDSLPGGIAVWLSATTDGSKVWGYIYNKYYTNGTPYTISTPRANYEQTEVNYHDIWMGGGSGSEMNMEYQDSSNHWNDWGYISGGYNNPYWIDLYSPNVTEQGGYGSSC